jgi:hypothetical protein
MISSLFFANVGDIHLGHPKTPTPHILQSLRLAFPDTEETGKLDIIFIEGDVFDRLLTLTDPHLPEIQFWMWWFLTMCAKRDITVIVLEGTPSHDWKQSELFVTIREVANIPVDLHYIKDLRVITVRNGVSVLCIPDEWRPDPNDTYQEAVAAIAEQGLDQVDLICMHGAFEYQLPSIVQAPTHSSERYLALAKHYIVIGHVHKAYPKDRILPAGSLDRLAHGEEEPKGHFRVQIDPVNGDLITFVENTNAKKYVTLSCVNMTLEESFTFLEKVQQLPEGSHVRVRAHRDDPILVNVELLRKRYPHCQWTTDVQKRDETEVQQHLLVDMRASYKEIQLSKSNLPGLIHERLTGMGYQPELISRGMALLAEAL